MTYKIVAHYRDKIPGCGPMTQESFLAENAEEAYKTAFKLAAGRVLVDVLVYTGRHATWASFSRQCDLARKMYPNG